MLVNQRPPSPNTDNNFSFTRNPNWNQGANASTAGTTPTANSTPTGSSFPSKSAMRRPPLTGSPPTALASSLGPAFSNAPVSFEASNLPNNGSFPANGTVSTVYTFATKSRSNSTTKVPSSQDQYGSDADEGDEKDIEMSSDSAAFAASFASISISNNNGGNGNMVMNASHVSQKESKAMAMLSATSAAASSARYWKSSLKTGQQALPQLGQQALLNLKRRLSEVGGGAPTHTISALNTTTPPSFVTTLSAPNSPDTPPGMKQKRRTLLPPQKPNDDGKLTVVLDMDETLIHSEFTKDNDYRQSEARQKATRPADFTITLYEDDPNMEDEIVHVYKRPGLDKFLEELSKICEPIIFTAALPVYARPILKQIDPKRRCKTRLYRNATIKYKGYPHVKCLKHLGRDLRRTVLVDNSPFAMCADPYNGIPIKSYYDDTTDNELEKLLEVIKQMIAMEDVRPFLLKKFNFKKMLAEVMPIE